MKIQNNNNKRPVWISFLGRFLIVTSLMHMNKLIIDFNWVQEIYSSWPGWLLAIRYCFSMGLRFLGLLGAFGILQGKEWARKLIIGIGWFTI